MSIPRSKHFSQTQQILYHKPKKFPFTNPEYPFLNLLKIENKYSKPKIGFRFNPKIERKWDEKLSKEGEESHSITNGLQIYLETQTTLHNQKTNPPPTNTIDPTSLHR